MMFKNQKEITMSCKAMILASAVAAASAAQADTTVFTLGPPYVNYLPVLTQDGVPTSGLWDQYYVYDCALKQECYGLPQHEIGIVLPTFSVMGCVGTVLVDTRPRLSKYPQPDGILQSSEVCYGDWTGVITYNYQSILQKHCSAGHPACASEYWPVLVSGSGTLTSP
jgi:hypothetical protein